ncbi:MAG: lamin tail domain-containing protein [Anaerolineales bacterium]|nr:lamin tail domain-containing protein [Anaerolineales bacterium]MCB9127478.1 lamin tail domain-containing protein [Ardenticatenales bacterium]MCB9172189.1 lamin tail domain-containing protein [Ardenticatenales bacterium]
MFDHVRSPLGLLLTLVIFASISVAATPSLLAQEQCRYFAETQFTVCDDTEAMFLTTFDAYGLQNVGYPVSRRYTRDGFVMQAFQKAIFQWRSDSQSTVFANIFDDLHRDQYDDLLLSVRQTPLQLPDDWDEEGQSFEEIVASRQALLDVRPALKSSYFAVTDPLLFFGLPTSEVEDMGNHYAVRLQRAVLQEWKEDVPWATAGEVTVANGGDITKELGALPADAVVPESAPTAPTPVPPPAAATTGDVRITDIAYDGIVYRVESDEYAKITNMGNSAVNLAGWRLYAGDPGQNFYFPTFLIQPGQSCRVYTNEYHPESCGFSFGRGSAIWNNDGDCGYLYDGTGAQVSQYCY